MQFKEVVTIPETPTTKRAPNKHTPEQECKRLLALWRESRSSIPRFCDNHGINVQTFYNWKRKYLTEPPKKPAFATRQKKAGHSSTISGVIKLALPNGAQVSLSIEGQTNSGLLSIIKEVAQWNFN